MGSREDGPLDLVLFGAPMDYTASGLPGARYGPRAIREASWDLEEYSPAIGRDLTEVNLRDYGDLVLPFGEVTESLRLIELAQSEILAAGGRPLALGGDHLVSLPLITEVFRHHPDLRVVHLDAHADLREEYRGSRYSHATVMRRVVEAIGPDRLWQFGIRSGTREEWQGSYRRFTDLEAFAQAVAAGPIYLSLDIDVLDPAFAPGTGTLEPGGLTSWELLTALGALRGANLVGADIVEVLPARDPGGRTATLAAKILREIILATGRPSSGVA